MYTHTHTLPAHPAPVHVCSTVLYERPSLPLILPAPVLSFFALASLSLFILLFPLFLSHHPLPYQDAHEFKQGFTDGFFLTDVLLFLFVASFSLSPVLLTKYLGHAHGGHAWTSTCLRVTDGCLLTTFCHA